MRRQAYILTLAGGAIALLLLLWPRSHSDSNSSPIRDREAQSNVQKQSAPNLVQTQQQSQSKASQPVVNTAQNERTPTPSATAAIPEHLRPILEDRSNFLPPSALVRITPGDVELLHEAYRQTTNILERHSLTWALAFVGNEESVQMFKQALTQDFAGKRLTGMGPGETTDEEYVLFHTVQALGHLAAKYDSAYDFIKQADISFWEANAQWESKRGFDTVGSVRAFSIHALGLSGRPEVPELLEKMKSDNLVYRSETDSSSFRGLDGSVVQAAFYYDTIQTRGRDFLCENLELEPRFKLFKAWSETESGKKWRAWSKQVSEKRFSEKR